MAGDFTTFDGIARPKLVRLVAANAVAVQPPAIASLSPEAVAVRPGEPVRIVAAVAGSAPLTYTWKINGTTVADSDPAFTVPSSLSGTYHVTLTATNRAGAITSAPVRVVVAPSPPIIVAQPAPVATRAGESATLSVTPIGSAPFAYEWFRGAARVGTSQRLNLSNVTAADAGDYTVVVRNSLGATTSQVVRLTVDDSARLVNISTRAGVAPGEQILIAGFVLGGTTRKDLLVRGAGPALAAFNLPGLLPNPVIAIHDSAGSVVATNDNWDPATVPATLFGSLGAFPFAGGSIDAALRVSLEPGAYTLHVTDSADRSGVALAEIYEADRSLSRLGNLSSRVFVGAGANLAISGIVVQGGKPGRFLIRAVGPALARFGVTGTLADPQLTLTTAASAVIADNDNWSTNANAAEIASVGVQAGAFPLAANARDAALLLTLNPGNYTALIAGAGDSTGVALVEVYEIP